MKRSILTFVAASVAASVWAQQPQSNIQSTDSLLIVQVQQVEVRAVRLSERVPMVSTVMNKEQIERENFGRDIPFVLSSQPSVVATSDAGTGVGYTGIRIRGTDATRINVTANSVPVNDAESHALYWVNMPDFASSLNDVQIQRGVGSSTNGSGAFGGSIAMQTESLTAKPYASLSLGYGSYGTNRQSVRFGTGLIGNRWSFGGRLSNIHSDGYIERARADLNSYFLQAGYYNGSTMLKFVTFGGKEQTYHAWNGVDADKMATNRRYNSCGEICDSQGNVTGYYDNQIDLYRQTHYQLLFSHLFSNSWDMNLTLHYTDGFGYYEEYKNDQSLEKYSLKPFETLAGTKSKSSLIRRKLMDNGFGGAVFAVNYRGERLSASAGGAANRYDGDHYGRVIWVENYVGKFDADHEYYRNNGVKNDANIYLKADWKATNSLSLYGDVQLRYVDYSIEGDNDKFDSSKGTNQYLSVDNNYLFFNPKGGINYQLSAAHRLYASVAVAHKEPTRNNFTDAKSSRTPLAERLVDYEAGWAHTGSRFDAGINLYLMNYKDQLVLTGEVNEIGEPLSDNVSRSCRMGVELSGAWRFARRWSWNVNATLSRNKIVDYTEYVDSYDSEWNYSQVATKLGTTDLAYSPSITACSVVAYRTDRLNVALQTNYVGKQYMTNSSNAALMLDDYCVTNLSAGYTFAFRNSTRLTLSGTLMNMFSAKYSSNGWGYSWLEQGVRHDSAGYFPQAPINFMVGAVLDF